MLPCPIPHSKICQRPWEYPGVPAKWLLMFYRFYLITDMFFKWAVQLMFCDVVDLMLCCWVEIDLNKLQMGSDEHIFERKTNLYLWPMARCCHVNEENCM